MRHLFSRFTDRFAVLVPKSARATAQIDLFAAVLYGLFGGLTTPFIPVIGRRMGASTLEVSLLVAAPALVLLLSLWWANVVRRSHPVRLVVWGAAIGRCLFLLTPWVQHPSAYVAMVLGYHAIASIGQLGYAQVMRAVYPADARGRIMGLVRVGMALAWIVGSLIGGRLMDAVSFRWVFAAAGLIGAASALVFSAIRAPEVEDEEDRITLRGTMSVLRGNRSFARLLIGFFIFGFGGWMMSAAVPILLVDVLQASTFQVGLLGAVTSSMWLVAYYGWGRAIDRRGPAQALSTIFLLGACTPVIFLLAGNAWIVLLAGITDGSTSAGVDLGWLTAILVYAPEGQVRHYVAIFNTLVGIRGLAAPLLASVLVPVPSVGPRGIFVISTLLMLSGAWVMRAAASARKEARHVATAAGRHAPSTDR